MPWEEWTALPWWLQRVYIDGLEREFSDGEGGHTGPNTDPGVVFNHLPGEMQALGFKERHLN